MLEEFVSRSRIRVSHLAVSILDAFSEPCSLEEAARLFPTYTPASVRREMRSLARFGLLVPSTRRVLDAAKGWKGSFAAAYLHFSTKSERYLETPEDELAYYLRRLSEERQPPLTKTYPRARRLALDGGAGGSLAGALEKRSTHRRFARRAVTFEELSTLVSRTFGRCGWVDGGVLGKKLAKTSPSAGARHPIECYALVWNVEGVPPGIYHYAVKHDALERLERCDPRSAAVAFASGQRWIARAGFACVLTAVAAPLPPRRGAPRTDVSPPRRGGGAGRFRHGRPPARRDRAPARSRRPRGVSALPPGSRGLRLEGSDSQAEELTP